MKHKKITVAAFLSLAIIIACKTKKTTSQASAPAKVEVSAAQLATAERKWPGTTTAELIEGRNIYTGKCTACHINFEITQFSEKKWLHEIDDMAPKANLTAEEKLKLTKHLLSYRETFSASQGN